MIKEYMTVEEAAKQLNRTKRHVSWLCTEGELKGAEKFGKRVWMIPRKSVLEYKPRPQGFAVDKARRDAEREAQRERINAAIRQGKALKQAETAAQKTEADRA